MEIHGSLLSSISLSGGIVCERLFLRRTGTIFEYQRRLPFVEYVKMYEDDSSSIISVVILCPFRSS